MVQKSSAMKKTNRNQNMPDQDERLRNDYSANTSSLNSSKNRSGKPERFRDSNLNQSNNTKQRYDDMTGTVENGIGKS